MTLSPGLVAAIAGVLAFFTVALPVVQAIIQKPWFPEHWKRGIQLGLSVIGGLAAYAAVSGFSVRTLPELLLWVLGALAATNIGYTGPLGGIAKAVEQATTKAPYDDAEVMSHIDLADDKDEAEVPLPDGWKDDPSLNPQTPEHALDEGRNG